MRFSHCEHLCCEKHQKKMRDGIFSYGDDLIKRGPALCCFNSSCSRFESAVLIFICLLSTEENDGMQRGCHCWHSYPLNRGVIMRNIDGTSFPLGKAQRVLSWQLIYFALAWPMDQMTIEWMGTITSFWFCFHFKKEKKRIFFFFFFFKF